MARRAGVPRGRGFLQPRRLARGQQVLQVTEAEARRRLTQLVAQAKEGAEGERDAALTRLRRWLSQTKAKPAQREKILEEEARFHDAAIAALDGATLELDQVALVQLL